VHFVGFGAVYLSLQSGYVRSNVGLVSHLATTLAGPRLDGPVWEVYDTKGRFTLWPFKLRVRVIAWPNFVESPKK
jgi:hypothetical protein